MRCPNPRCNFVHTEITGRLMALFPTFGVREVAAVDGVAAGLFGHGKNAVPKRMERAENGSCCVRCLACGHTFGFDSEGPFAPVVDLQSDAAPPAPPPQASRPRLVPRPEPETPPREPHLIDDDMVEAPSME
jgi:hypothetical protein